MAQKDVENYLEKLREEMRKVISSELEEPIKEFLDKSVKEIQKSSENKKG
jgi:preprotein translocase subunit SecE